MQQAVSFRRAALYPPIKPSLLSKARFRGAVTSCSVSNNFQENSCRPQDQRNGPKHDNEGSLAKAKCWCGKSRKKPWCDGSHAKKVMNITENTKAGTAYCLLE